MGLLGQLGSGGNQPRIKISDPSSPLMTAFSFRPPRTTRTLTLTLTLTLAPPNLTPQTPKTPKPPNPKTLQYLALSPFPPFLLPHSANLTRWPKLARCCLHGGEGLSAAGLLMVLCRPPSRLSLLTRPFSESPPPVGQ